MFILYYAMGNWVGGEGACLTRPEGNITIDDCHDAINSPTKTLGKENNIDIAIVPTNSHRRHFNWPRALQ